MAKRVISPVLKSCACTINPYKDREITKPHLAMTPQQVKELTDRGIAVSLPNGQFLDGESNDGWSIDPVFKRDADLPSTWELETLSRSKLIRAHRADKKKFGE